MGAGALAAAAPLTRAAGGAAGAVGRFVERRAVARAALAVPRTVRFMAGALITGEVDGSLPAPRLSPGLAGQVAIDELVLSLALSPRWFPASDDYERVGAEVAAAGALYRRQGWLADPASYHRTPPSLAPGDVTVHRRWAGINYERVDFDSGFEPREGEPGAGRWTSYAANHRASAVVLRHPGRPRPWVVAVHGFCMGWPSADFRGLHARQLHHDLGVNVALPVLPLHGPRKVTPVSGLNFLSFEVMNGIHGLTQSVWDVRRLLTWIRDQGAPSVALYGISLGGHVVSLLSGIEPGIDAVVAGVPVTDLPALYEAHSPERVRTRAEQHGAMGEPARAVHSVVSPMCFTPQVAHERRFLFGGYGDRMARPSQAHRLWLHWERPQIHWYAGNHLGYLWSPPVAEFLVSSLRSAGVAHPAAAGPAPARAPVPA